MKKRATQGMILIGTVLSLALLAGCAAPPEEYTSASFAMNTVVSQTAYGPRVQQAMQEVNQMLAGQEKRLSLYGGEGDIARINAAAGGGGTEVAPETAGLLRQAQALSAQSEGAFAVTVAPLTLAWGITGDSPRVVPQEELDGLLPLVDDTLLRVEGQTVWLPKEGMGIDLGGIAKGAACAGARQIYEENGVESALLSIGGNVYARGTKPDGSPWKVGFRDPQGGEESYIATFHLRDEVVAVSGGYERYFEQDGKKYIHIIHPRTGLPVESDILSVGVIDPDGAVADFWSTTLFVWGRDKALGYLRRGGKAVLLDNQNRLYVSAALREDFALVAAAGTGYELHFVEAEGAA